MWPFRRRKRRREVVSMPDEAAPRALPADEPGMPGVGFPEHMRCRWCSSTKFIARGWLYCPACDRLNSANPPAPKGPA